MHHSQAAVTYCTFRLVVLHFSVRCSSTASLDFFFHHSIYIFNSVAIIVRKRVFGYYITIAIY